MDDRFESQPIRVGIIGLGYWGPKLARNLHSLPGVAMEMAADLRQDRLDDLKKFYPDIKVGSDRSNCVSGVQSDL